MAVGAIIGQIIGTGMQMGGAAVSGMAAEASYEAKQNIANMNAQAAKDSYELEKLKLDREVAKQIGRSRASIAASGVAYTGSAADIMAENEMFAALDQEILRYNRDLAVTGYEYEAQMARYGEKQQEKATALSVGSSLFSGIGGMFGSK